MIAVKAIFAFCALSGRNSFRFRSVDAKMFVNTVHFNAGPPFLRRLVPGYADNPRSVVQGFSCISPIFSSGNKSQVLRSIVAFVTVDMINFMRRPVASEHGHDYAVCPENFIVNTPHPVSMTVRRSKRLPSRPSGVPSFWHVVSLSPKQFSRFRLIAQQLMEGINVW